MLNFRTYLVEQEEEGKKLKHLTHIEDLPIHQGNAGVSQAHDTLMGMHDKLLGHENDIPMSTKYDGAPSIVYGHHPQTGKFFVASKSAFNKNPKINYTDADIEQNHGHAPGLVEKLKAALRHLPKIAPRQGVYQGDVMYTKPDIEDHDGKYHFTPNTIQYSVPKESNHGRSIKAAKFGLVTHTKYEGGPTLEKMGATPNVDHKNFRYDPDVHNINPETKIDPSKYTPAMQRDFLNHMENARATYSRMKPEALDALQGHGENLEAHINDMVRKGGKPSVEGYVDHLTNRAQKGIDAVKTDAAKLRKSQEHAGVLQHINANKKHFADSLELHNHLQKAKNVLVHAANQGSDFEHHAGGEEVGPEGYVINGAKAVDRGEFSRLNFLKGKMGMRNREEEK